MDIKGLYLMCGQIECLCCKPSFDKDHPNVCCVLGQGYLYGVVPECLLCPSQRQAEAGQGAYCRVCKGSQQAFCIQNRCSLPCDDEVPTTCTCCGHRMPAAIEPAVHHTCHPFPHALIVTLLIPPTRAECCQHMRKTGDVLNRAAYNYELVPFLPYPEVRVMDETAIKRGGDADEFAVHWLLTKCLDVTGDLINTTQYHIANACLGYTGSVGCDFPTCIGASLVGSCLCCVEVNCVICKPVEDHKRVEVICCQGGGYLARPRNGTCCGASCCKGNGNICCTEHRYALPPEESFAAYPVRCTACGAQCCRFGSDGGEDCQCAGDRRCCAKIDPLPRVKPAVAEASDVLYHETRSPLKNQLASLGDDHGSAQSVSPEAQTAKPQAMQRV
jgi:hypothetical protein